MAKTLNGRPADFKAEIANEVDLALQKLGAKPGLPSQTEGGFVPPIKR